MMIHSDGPAADAFATRFVSRWGARLYLFWRRGDTRVATSTLPAAPGWRLRGHYEPGRHYWAPVVFVEAEAGHE